MGTSALPARSVILFQRMIFSLLGAVISLKALSDPDLGWHLAGGMWMLNEQRLPYVDPLGSDLAVWINYSWLFDLLSALLFRFGEFNAIAAAQFSLGGIVGYLISLQLSFNPKLLLLSALTLLGVSPILYWRPQAWSLILFWFLLTELRRSEARFLRLLLLTVFWVQIHVFWIAVPALVGLQSLLKLRLNQGLFAIALVLVGTVNPYGYQIYTELFRYITQHQVAYGLITEFKPLSLDAGIFLIVFCAFVLLGLKKCAASLSERGQSFWVICFLALAVLSLMQIKYLPFFSVFCLLFLVDGTTDEGKASFSSAIGSFFSLVLLFVLTNNGADIRRILYDTDNLLSPSAEELLSMPADFGRLIRSDAGTFFAFTEFDSGGWLELGCLLHGACKVSIDGRTLVMGESKLAAYGSLHKRNANECEFFNSRKFQVGVLDKRGSIAKKIASQNHFWCKLHWEPIFESNQYLLFHLNSETLR